MKLFSKPTISQTKQGVASLYVVLFATILFGVITVSFARIIISESTQNSNDDLSTSAYDAALAGVEDAKIMINKYYSCVAAGGSNCNEYNIFSDITTAGCENGFPLAQKLYGVDGEIILQETNTNSDTFTDQAYTCVLVSDTTADYRSTLSSDTRTRVIPIQVSGTGMGDVDVSKVKKLQFSWYSDLNQGQSSVYRYASDGKLRDKSSATNPPTVQLSFISAPATINADDFMTENGKNGVIDSQLVFLPADPGTTAVSVTTVTASTILAHGQATKNSATESNPQSPLSVTCYPGEREFACVVELDIAGLPLASDSNAFLVASLPYGDTYTDFAIRLLDENGDSINFKGAQVSVDSTGRTNELRRRVEVRLDPADLFFPYPEYALTLTGGSDASLVKQFWVTANCWYSDNRGHRSTCNNNGSTL